VLPDKVFSPRLALVFQPNEDHAFRASYNRAFSTPTALNHFLDLGAGFAPSNPNLIGVDAFSARASGTGRNGFSWRNPDGGYWMRSPYNRGGEPGAAGELLTLDHATLWSLGLDAYAEHLGEEVMAALRRIDPEDVGMRFLIPVQGRQPQPLESLGAEDISPIKETTSETFELGWSGVFGEALRLSVDGYYRRQSDFVSPLTTASPFFLFDGAELAAAYVPLRVADLVAGGLSVDQATAIALNEARDVVGPTTGTTPLAVGVSDIHGQRTGGADIIQTYRNIDEVLDVWGVDASLQWLVTPRWTVSATYSHVSEDLFEIEGSDPIALNAPTDKGTLGLAYRDQTRGWNASARLRYSDAFPFRATVFDGEIDAYALVDLTLGYRIPRSGATVQLGVSNVLNEAYQSFIGAPFTGRLAMLRVVYEF
jgi:iron complex outermembrane receptor protein